MLLAPTKTADNLILRFEDLRLRPYRDVRGLWTIGVGHLMDQDNVNPNLVITKEDAMILFDIDVHEHWTWLDRLVHVQLNTHQVDALTSFIFNVGPDAFAGSTMHRRIQAGQIREAAARVRQVEPR
jgi:lysozyme